MGTIPLGISVYITTTYFSSNKNLKETKIFYDGKVDCQFNTVQWNMIFYTEVIEGEHNSVFKLTNTL